MRAVVPIIECYRKWAGRTQLCLQVGGPPISDRFGWKTVVFCYRSRVGAHSKDEQKIGKGLGCKSVVDLTIDGPLEHKSKVLSYGVITGIWR
jgi:hypothetical protein